MQEQSFILAAYLISGLLIALLCIATWWRARQTRRILAGREDA